MSTREESEAGRCETRRAYEDHKHRYIASGGNGRRFDGPHLQAAAVRRAERTLDDSGREQGAVERPVTEHEIRLMLGDLATRPAWPGRRGGCPSSARGCGRTDRRWTSDLTKDKWILA